MSASRKREELGLELREPGCRFGEMHLSRLEACQSVFDSTKEVGRRYDHSSADVAEHQQIFVPAHEIICLPGDRKTETIGGHGAGDRDKFPARREDGAYLDDRPGSADDGDPLDFEEQRRIGKVGDRDDGACRKIVAQEVMAHLGEGFMVNRVGDENGHRHHVG
jgi:hypothetical protein